MSVSASASLLRPAPQPVQATVRTDSLLQQAERAAARPGAGGYTCQCIGCTAAASAVAAAGSPAPAPAPRAAAAAPASYTDTIRKSGTKSVDALLAGGNRWFHTPGADGSVPSAVARTSLTYSFFTDAGGLNAMDANGFEALSSPQRDVVRRALDYISTVAGVSFTEVSGGGDIQYGINIQDRSAGYARYPNEGSQVFLAKNTSSFAGDWAEGSYEWQVILHETGHALGLKHPGNYNAGGGGTAGPYLARSLDNRGNTIMSYYNASNMKRIQYDGEGFQASHVNADTFQAYDIAALQYLYGAASSQAATFSWSDGQALSQTLWNNHPDSRIDLSNQTRGNIVDLRAGYKSSIGIRDAYEDMPFSKAEYARLTSGGRKIKSIIGTPTYTGRNNLTIAKGSRINAATGGSGNDTFIGNGASLNTLDGGSGNDRFFVGKGSAAVTGGEGTDTAYLARKKGYTWRLSEDRGTATLSRTDKRTKVTTTFATVSLEGIEQVRLWDGKALKATGRALYSAPAGAALNAVA
jgi:hypothetical protein